ncbi:hypothetical protein BX616_010942 [Lobosporangium transversale]|uniref:NADH-ubiquinone oxidoreductase 9.5 kDa subunit n=1 Tax=Lobosporangium transversale TaxID=64571 RepID=A0A1Y2GLP7_9FUNG|nr:hypothetical protein BCR41DRAFT_396552 [Lobosporangium transversale]KAF9910095.1 hypothetical protein BX616_010942 [Lobosporangium transversale]ORZ14813.1 hypothetical protein BCR41DRAFT_396552 [Lobosporangium transversale]|eukprot:XP_021880945.1 hypothetical protein BCR41DRAFT_396552 [Lobosporangium transversale]
MVLQYLKRSADKNPYIFVSFVIAAIGPALVVGVPPIRKSMGYVSPARIPETYPLPRRARNPPSGYED